MECAQNWTVFGAHVRSSREMAAYVWWNFDGIEFVEMKGDGRSTKIRRDEYGVRISNGISRLKCGGRFCTPFVPLSYRFIIVTRARKLFLGLYVSSRAENSFPLLSVSLRAHRHGHQQRETRKFIITVRPPPVRYEYFGRRVRRVEKKKTIR